MINPADFKGVIVLYNDSSHLIKGEKIDLISDQDVIQCATGISKVLESLSIPNQLIPIRGEVESVLTPFHPADWLVFNLAEGWGGRLYEEARAAWILELMGYCFTGSSGRAIALTTNKALTKAFLSRAGLRTPAWWLFHTPDQVLPNMNFPFPLFVKPVAEDASLGIGNDSVITGHNSLRDRVAYIVERYHQSALVEEFITGREINAAAWGDPLQLLPLAEIDFSAFSDPYARIINYAAKWEEGAYEFHHTPAICPANLPRSLENRISRTAIRALHCSGAHNYARVDLRVKADGTPYILEINCNPDISRGAGFFRAVEQTGLTYQDMVLKILTHAKRHSDEYRTSRRSR